MALKTIKFTVGTDGGLSPSTVQKAGVQGNHRIYEAVFELNDELYAWLQEKGNEGKLVYRFDGYDGTGMVHHSDTAILCEKSVSYPLEYPLTKYGGLVKVELIITLIKEQFEDGEALPDITDEVLHTHAARLKLVFSPFKASEDEQQIAEIPSLVEIARENAQRAIKAAEEAVEAQKLTEELSVLLQSGAEWVFDGGDASSEMDIQFVIDKQMSDYSNNAIANRVIKAYIDGKVIEQADHFVEVGKSGIWNYEKRASGIAECWAVLSVKISELVRWDEYHYYQSVAEYEFPRIDGNPLFVDISTFDYDIGNYQTKGFGRGSVYTLREGHNSTSTGMLYIAGISKNLSSYDEVYTREDGLKVYKIPEDMEVIISLTAKGRWK